MPLSSQLSVWQRLSHDAHALARYVSSSRTPPCSASTSSLRPWAAVLGEPFTLNSRASVSTASGTSPSDSVAQRRDKAVAEPVWFPDSSTGDIHRDHQCYYNHGTIRYDDLLS